jgi:hypothetical protein
MGAEIKGATHIDISMYIDLHSILSPVQVINKQRLLTSPNLVRCKSKLRGENDICMHAHEKAIKHWYRIGLLRGRSIKMRSKRGTETTGAICKSK